MIIPRKFRRWRVACCVILLVLFSLSCLLQVIMFSNAVYCLKWKTKDIISRLCNDYNKGAITGQLCQTLCDRSTEIQTQSCYAPHLAKDVVFTTILEHKIVVIKSQYRHAHSSDPLPTHIDSATEQDFNNSLTELVNIVGNIIKISINDEEYGHNYLYTFLNSILIKDFGVSSLKTIENKATLLKSLWLLVQQKEYLTFKLLENSGLFPQVIGSCGHLYAVEYLQPLTQFLKSNWRLRVEITLKMIDWLETAQFHYSQPVHFCDIKLNHFGIVEMNGAVHSVKFLDGDDIFFRSSLDGLLNYYHNCTSNKDCTYFDCQMACNTKTSICDISTLNNNLRVICSKIFTEPTSITSAAFRPNFLQSLPVTSETEALRQLFTTCSFAESTRVNTETFKIVLNKLL